MDPSKKEDMEVAQKQNKNSQVVTAPKVSSKEGLGHPDQAITGSETLRTSIVRKYDIRILPLIFMAWSIFYLDRAAIALARVNGMEADLRLSGYQFNIALMIFFALYIIFNLPGNLILRKVGGGLFLPAIVVAWGLVTTFTGFVTNFATLCVTRVFLGISESAFLGVAMLYLAFFYTEFELISRVGLFYSGNALAGAFGGFLATGLGRIRFRGYNGWPWIFFVEGIITVIVGIGMYFILPDSPQTAGFLSSQERVLAVERMLATDRRHEALNVLPADSHGTGQAHVDETGQPIVRPDRLTLAAFKRAALNPVTIMMALATFMTIEALYSFTLFLPSIILAMGYHGTKLNLLTVPPNLVAFVLVIAITQYSQRSGKKAVPMLAGGFMAIIGYLLLLIGSRIGLEEDTSGVFGSPQMSVSKTASTIQYVGTFFVAIGVNVIPPIALAWTCINATPHYVRALVLGVIITLGNTAAFLSSFTYIKTEAPRQVYTTGHAINLACCVVLVAIAFSLIAYMRRENEKREHGKRNYRLEGGAREGRDNDLFELELGWMHPRHRFQW
ncbi:related to putative tartrate transporter [Cephalotrichum gorgonifer]|uniref:Related to putative tartrate transporter n=1 Tax=Cephalotrichum gorgonifer TaxID=2041049 RepID=A0AAE8SS30_9PEZI|nr:related to putative tartrate transporter [Cephalotrichum gorgonifer]